MLACFQLDAYETHVIRLNGACKMQTY